MLCGSEKLSVISWTVRLFGKVGCKFVEKGKSLYKTLPYVILSVVPYVILSVSEESRAERLNYRISFQSLSYV